MAQLPWFSLAAQRHSREANNNFIDNLWRSLLAAELGDSARKCAERRARKLLIMYTGAVLYSGCYKVVNNLRDC